MERLPFIESVGPVRAALGPGGNLALIVPVQESPPGWFSGDIDFTSTGGFNGGGEVVFTNLFGTGRRLELRGASVDWGAWTPPVFTGSPGYLVLRFRWSSPVTSRFPTAEAFSGNGPLH